MFFGGNSGFGPWRWRSLPLNGEVKQVVLEGRAHRLVAEDELRQVEVGLIVGGKTIIEQRDGNRGMAPKVEECSGVERIRDGRGLFGGIEFVVNRDGLKGGIWGLKGQVGAMELRGLIERGEEGVEARPKVHRMEAKGGGGGEVQWKGGKRRADHGLRLVKIGGGEDRAIWRVFFVE